MDFIDQIQTLATKIHRQRDQLQKESGFLRLFKIKYLGELLTVKLEGRVSL